MSQTRVSCIGRRILNHCATRETQHALLISVREENFGILIGIVLNIQINLERIYFFFLTLTLSYMNIVELIYSGLLFAL